MKKEQQYKDKLIMAPMVRIGTLPMRLLALDYGADLVYCEEIIDRKILMCQKYENEVLNTTDFCLSDGTVVFRTCQKEKDKLIFQIGTSDARRALAAAKKIEDCVAGIDVNMGCPKEFSIKGGMGAALLTQPEKVQQILTTLVNGLSVPVTCKIRCLPSLEDTIKLAQLIESTGVSAIGIHGRTKEERPRDENRNHYIKAVSEKIKIPVIANGGSKQIKSREDIHHFIRDTGATSAMIARAAEWNCSVFRQEGTLPVLDVLKEYLRYAFKYDNNSLNTKYCVLQMLHDRMTDTPQADSCLTAKLLEDFAVIWSMKSEYEEILAERKAKEQAIASRLSDSDQLGVKHKKLDNGIVYIELPVRYEKRLYSVTMTPKQTLNNWTKKNLSEQPVYTTTERPGDRCFHSYVMFQGKAYSNPHWEKSKQLAEQGAALACLLANGMDDGCLTQPNEETRELHDKWLKIIKSNEKGEESMSKMSGDSNPIPTQDNGARAMNDTSKNGLCIDGQGRGEGCAD